MATKSTNQKRLRALAKGRKISAKLRATYPIVLRVNEDEAFDLAEDRIPERVSSLALRTLLHRLNPRRR